MISLAFIIAWTPYAVISLWTTAVDANSLPLYFPILSLLPCLFAKTSTIMNPCIYFFSVQQFQRHATDTFVELLNNAPNAPRTEEMDTIRTSSLRLRNPEENEEMTWSVLWRVWWGYFNLSMQVMKSGTIVHLTCIHVLLRYLVV